MLEHILKFMESNTYLIYSGVIIFALLDCVPLLGMFFPGTVYLMSIALLSSFTNEIHIYYIIILAIIGALLGDLISYYFGSKKLIKLPKEEINKSKRVYKHHKTLLVFLLFKLNGIIRPMLGYFCRTQQMSIHLFLIYDSIAVILWSIIHTLPLYLLGQHAIKYIKNLNLVVWLILVGIIIYFLKSEKKLDKLFQ